MKRFVRNYFQAVGICIVFGFALTGFLFAEWAGGAYYGFWVGLVGYPFAALLAWSVEDGA